MALDLANDALNFEHRRQFLKDIGNDFGNSVNGTTGFGSGGRNWGMESFYCDDEEEPPSVQEPVIVLEQRIEEDSWNDLRYLDTVVVTGYEQGPFGFGSGGGGGGDEGESDDPQERNDCSGIQSDVYPERYPEEVGAQDLEEAAQRAFDLIHEEVGAETEQEIVYGIYTNADGEVSIERIKAGPICDRFDGESARVVFFPIEMFDSSLGKLVGWVHNQFSEPDPSAGDVELHQRILEHYVANLYASENLVMFIGQMSWQSGDAMELNAFADVESENVFDRKNL